MRAYSIMAAAALGLTTLVTLPACQTVTGKVPSTAMEVSAGTGNLTYRAADSGHVYVYNARNNTLVYSGDIREGSVLTLDTAGDRVLVDARPVVERINLDGNDRYQIFLDPASRVVGRRTVESGSTTTVVERRPVVERREVVAPRTTYERREVVVPKTTYERREVVVPKTTYDRTTVDVPTGTAVERRTLIGPDGRTVIEREVRER